MDTTTYNDVHETGPSAKAEMAAYKKSLIITHKADCGSMAFSKECLTPAVVIVVVVIEQGRVHFDHNCIEIQTTKEIGSSANADT